MNLTQLEFTKDDFTTACEMAKELGYGESTAYTSSSALIGLFCLPQYKAQKPGCIIKTQELGFLFVQSPEDLGLSV